MCGTECKSHDELAVHVIQSSDKQQGTGQVCLWKCQFFVFFSFWVNKLAPPHPISQSLWTLRGNMTARIFVCWACLFTLIPSQMLPDIAAVSSRQLLLKLISQCLQEEGAGEAGGGGNLVRGGNYEIWQRGRQAFWHSHSLGLRCDV